MDPVCSGEIARECACVVCEEFVGFTIAAGEGSESSGALFVDSACPILSLWGKNQPFKRKSAGVFVE